VAAEFVDPGAALSQGDLLLAVPSVYVRSLSYLIKTADNQFKLSPRPPQAEQRRGLPQVNVGEEVEHEAKDPFGNAVGARRPGLVISHDCELDKTSGTPTVLVAQVRRLENMLDEDMDRIRAFREKRAFYLPPCDHLEGENFADLRVITTLVREDVIDQLDVAASLDEEGVEDLQAQLFRFFVRKRLPDEWIDWPREAEAEGDQ
jgi:hypothetical protein